MIRKGIIVNSVFKTLQSWYKPKYKHIMSVMLLSYVFKRMIHEL